MSSADEVSEIFESLKGLPEDLQKSITSKFAKLSGLKQLTGETALQRDGARLEARQRAYYRKMGLDVPEDGEMITNILADNITIGEDPVIAKRNIQNDPATVEPQPAPQPPSQPPVSPAPPKKEKDLNPWLAAAMIAAMTSGVAGPIVGYMMNRADKNGGSIFRFQTNDPEWMEPPTIDQD